MKFRPYNLKKNGSFNLDHASTSTQTQFYMRCHQITFLNIPNKDFSYFTQNQAISLFEASAKGDVTKVKKLNDASYQDKVILKLCDDEKGESMYIVFSSV